ncbi:MAG TPA: glycosyltransferase family 9 protein [Candidatus Omnitrophota bacterium]|nr:glycosyltransferase family 9 protein [Candidatus Omnitrophota bacterium]
MLLTDAGNILVIQLAGLGDMVLALPALTGLRESFPNARISVLSNSRAKEVIRGLGWVDELFVCDNYGDFLFKISALRKKNFDMVINLYRIYSWAGAVKMFFVFSCIGGKYWVGRDTDSRGFFYNIKVKEDLPDDIHEVEHKLACIRAVAPDLKDVKPDLRVLPQDQRALELVLESEGIKPGDLLVGINCATFDPSRNWPSSCYARLAEILSFELKAKVAFSAAEKDRAFLKNIKRSTNAPIVDLCGKLTVGELIAFIKKCDVYVTPDSGPMHIAAFLGVPLLALFGEGEYSELRPFGRDDKIIVIRKPVKLITPSEAAGSVRELLEHGKKDKDTSSSYA